MGEEGFRETLDDFAFCYESRYADLAADAMPEEWGYRNKLLRNYIDRTYRRVALLAGRGEEGACWREGGLLCFNTGLYTPLYEPMYALFEPNAREGAREPWFLKGFFRASSHELDAVDELPGRVRFYDDPSELIYDHRLPVRVNYDHILGDRDNLSRVPECLRGEGRALLLRRTFEGAVEEAKRRVGANYTLAVPEYYNDRIQLMLPICLTGSEPELALTIQREGGWYSARTCLTLEMAYCNARLVARPEASWVFRGAGLGGGTPAA